MYKQSVITYIFYNYLYIDCILTVNQPDYGHRCDHYMLVKNNTTRLKIFINVDLLVYYISIQNSFMHGCGTHKIYYGSFPRI